jgi:hypothetical protein
MPTDEGGGASGIVDSSPGEGFDRRSRGVTSSSRSGSRGSGGVGALMTASDQMVKEPLDGRD